MPTGIGRRAGLADLAPILLLCEESVVDLNARRATSGLPPVGIDRFRPNLVLSGCLPYEEDSWCEVRIGSSAVLKLDGPCPRCTVPDVEQTSGRVDSPTEGPMRTLRSYRSRAGQGVLFGGYFSSTSGTVSVGDAVVTRPC
eukprot:1664607-Prymnesium_polylepis.2